MQPKLLIVVLLVSLASASIADAGLIRRTASRGKAVVGKVLKCVGGCR
jgi:hypothetical protein